MLVQVNHSYPCTVAELLPLFCDANHLQTRQQLLGFRNLDLRRCEFDGTRGALEFYREVPAAGDVPRAIRHFQQDWNRISQREYWHLDNQGIAHCSYSLRIPGMPLTMDGSMRIEPQNHGCSNRVSLDIQCSVPLIGRLAVNYLAEDALHKLEQEYRVLLALMPARAA